MREMLVFWKKNEREERDVRKRAEKEAVDRAKEEEEKREAARHARKLEFLISQTELYSHFVGNKLKSECWLKMLDYYLMANARCVLAAEAEKTLNHDVVEEATGNLPSGAEMVPFDEPLEELDFDNGEYWQHQKYLSLTDRCSDDQTNLFRHAARNAQDAIQLARNRAREFDEQTALDRMTSEATPGTRDMALDGKEDQGDPFSGAASGSAPIMDCKCFYVVLQKITY